MSEPIIIKGYAARFGEVARLWWMAPICETLLPGCFSKALADRNLDCVCNFNHDPNGTVASVRGGTLQVEQDDLGLHFRAKLPNTANGRNMAELIRREDIRRCSFSFGFESSGVTYETFFLDGEEVILGRVKEIALLSDVAPCSAATVYRTTSVEIVEPADKPGRVRRWDWAPATPRADRLREQYAADRIIAAQISTPRLDRMRERHVALVGARPRGF